MTSPQRLLELSDLTEVAAKRITPKPEVGQFEAAAKGAVVCFFCNSLFATIVGVSPRKAEFGLTITAAIVFVAEYLWYRHLWRKWSRIHADWLRMLVNDEEKSIAAARQVAEPPN